MRFFSTLLASTLGTLLALGTIFFFVLLFLVALAASSDPAPRIRPGSVLVVTLDGDLPEVVSGDPLSQAFGGEPAFDLHGLTKGLRMAAADSRIEAVWLRIGQAPSSWAVLEEVRDALVAFKASGKPMYASSDDYMMDEAEYFLASTADSVFAAPEGIFEFNGFVMTAEFYKKLLDKLDIVVQPVRAGTFKAAVEPFTREDLSPENEAQLTAMVTAVNEVFMQRVAESRGLTVAALEAYADEATIITTADAQRAGLLDALLFEDGILNLFKARLGLEADDDLREVSMDAYARVPATEAGLDEGDEGEIAVVYAVGGIMPGESGTDPNPLFGGKTVGAETFIDAIREAREREEVRAVVLRIDSPGGFAPAADAMLHEIALTRREKPVIVSMGAVAASGGYWIATAADTIVAEPLTITGSIGVFSLFFDLSGFFENQLGLTFETVQTSPYADLFSPLRSLTDAEERRLQVWTDSTYAHFLQLVAESRGMTTEAVDAVAQGRVWMGRDAQRIGLVDVLGGLDVAVALAAERAGLDEGTYRLRTLPRPKTLLEELNARLGAQATQAWMGMQTTPAERTLLEQARLLHRLTQDHATPQARLPFDARIR